MQACRAFSFAQAGIELAPTLSDTRPRAARAPSYARRRARL